MIRNTDTNATTGEVVIEEIDTDAGTISRYEAGALVWSRALTADERAQYAPAPADPFADLLAQAATATTVTKLRTVLTDLLTQLSQ